MSSAGHIRNKQGSLELYKGKKWKSYYFKVTGNTYFHYFNEKKMAEPKEQIFLTTIRSVEVPLKVPKDSRPYVFEVKHSGKTSPWILNAPSEMERYQWMEAISPGSAAQMSPKISCKVPNRTPSPVFEGSITSTLPQFNSVMPQSNPVSPNAATISHYTNSPSPSKGSSPRSPLVKESSLPIIPVEPRPPSTLQRNMTSCRYPMIPSQSEDNGSNHQPADYIDPVQLNTPCKPPTSSLPTSLTNSNGVTASQNPYLKMESPPQRKSADYLRLQSQTGTPQPQTQSTEDQIMTLLKGQFTSGQMSMLLNMLTTLQTDSKSDGTDVASSDEQIGGKLSYLVNKTAGSLNDSLLVTEDDDPESYDKRPSWAKANCPSESCMLAASLADLELNKISPDELTDLTAIGAGQFGQVYSANYLPNNMSQYNPIKVAIKTTKNNPNEQQKKDMLGEIAVMSNMVHPNIVRLYGIIDDGLDVPSIVLEYMPFGDLKDYLSKSPKKPIETLVKYMVDVAMGMHYIAERGLVHRDLAARNVLVGVNELCKVGDFGMLRELPSDDSIYVSSSNIPCPIRWMPPEAISSRSFSVSSDVWSFGILLWEILNPGKIPYARMDNYQVISKINDGYRMPTPRGCPPMIGRIMKACWHIDPSKRPSFLAITSLLTTRMALSPTTEHHQSISYVT